jgi:hypothetical protein
MHDPVGGTDRHGVNANIFAGSEKIQGVTACTGPAIVEVNDAEIGPAEENELLWIIVKRYSELICILGVHLTNTLPRYA